MAKRLYENTRVVRYSDGGERVRSWLYVPLGDRETGMVAEVLLHDEGLLRRIVEVKRSRSREAKQELIQEIAERIARMFEELEETGRLKEYEELERKRTLRALFVE